MRYVVGVPAYSLKLFLDNPKLFSDANGYVLDSVDLSKKLLEHADRVVNILRSHVDEQGLLLDYEELGMYVVNPVAIMEVHKEEERIVFVVADKVVGEPIRCEVFEFVESPVTPKEE